MMVPLLMLSGHGGFVRPFFVGVPPVVFGRMPSPMVRVVPVVVRMLVSGMSLIPGGVPFVFPILVPVPSMRMSLRMLRGPPPPPRLMLMLSFKSLNRRSRGAGPVPGPGSSRRVPHRLRAVTGLETDSRNPPPVHHDRRPPTILLPRTLEYHGRGGERDHTRGFRPIDSGDRAPGPTPTPTFH